MRNRGASVNEIEEIYRERFRAFACTVTAALRDGDAALDVVQDGFALALQKRSSFRGDRNLEAWLWRIVLNVASDYGRRRRRERDRVGLAEPSNDASDTPTLDLQASLLALPERQRLAVFLRYYGDLSYEQIAEALGVRVGTVAASLNAAHVALRRELEEVRR